MLNQLPSPPDGLAVLTAWLAGWLAGTAREHQFSFVQICLRTNIETHVHSSQHQDLLLTFYFGHILKSQTLISILANREENGE